MRRPTPRGPASAALLLALDGAPEDTDLTPLDAAVEDALQVLDLLPDDDVQLTLFLLYELHYSGLEGVDEQWEWHPPLLAVRHRIEQRLEAQLRAQVPMPESLPAAEAAEVAAALFAMTAADAGPDLSGFVARRADRDQVSEWLVHRSVYQLKEADPHTWAIPRLRSTAKAALVEIQADEYGGGDPARMHAALFARTMRGLGLDDTYGAYVDAVPGLTLASTNMMSMFGLHRRLRGAVVGHLAAFEMTSSIPNRRYGNGFRRLGLGPDVTEYFDEHVEADAVHEQIAAHDMAGALARDEPGTLPDIVFGAAACLYVDGVVGQALLDAFRSGRSSLRAAAVVAAS